MKRFTVRHSQVLGAPMCFAATLASALLFPLASPAFAHAHLKVAEPAADATLNAAPDHLDLTFSESINPNFSGVTMTADDAAMVPLGSIGLVPGGEATLRVPLPATLRPGHYRVEWHVLARDGHKTRGIFSLTIRPEL